MGGRCAFKNINAGDFSFVENGQTYATIGYVDNVEILIRKGNLSIKAPEFSHTSNRIYAIINRRNQMKCLTWYDEHNRQVYSIDFDHKHGWDVVQPHVHYNMRHEKAEPGTSPTASDYIIINKVNRWLKRG